MSHPDLRPSKIGLTLFALYCLLYGGFMFVAVTDIGKFRSEVFGVNLAVAWGFGLIGGAFLLAIIYLFVDKAKEDEA
jgi:hypothetical protein